MTASSAQMSDSDVAVTPSQLFVINLCASTSPMALSHPSAPELKRYTFFVSRQRDDGRERFRLHMGYFPSQDEAEKLLEAVRDVYPAAWAGLAPSSGAPRRNRVAAMVAVKAPAPEMVPVQAVPVTAPPLEVLNTMSNVRDVLAQLSEATVPLAAPSAAAPDLNERQVLRVLEAPVESVAARGEDSQVRLIRPEDTQSLTDIRIDARNDTPPCFALQLVWSTSPINVASLPHLAIFDAYTLYNVEGSREGRKWYGVRLGFFTDSASASQVANYVRSDYRSVAIMPVAIRERDRAGGGAAVAKEKPSPRRSDSLPTPEATLASITGEVQGFELLADDRPAPQRLDLDDAAVAPVKVAVPIAKPLVSRAPKAAGKPPGKRVVVRKRPVAPVGRAAPGAPQPLESTLEILGASTLTLDDESRTIINDSAVRKPLKKNSGGNRFARLLSRLSSN
ncbi:MAG: hypothetical protein ABIQ86_06720 [Steroidobacteraceae bacterium]